MEGLFGAVEVAEAEVDELEVEVFVEQQIRRLDVAVRDAERVHVLNGGDQLAEVLVGFFFAEPGQPGLLAFGLDELGAFAAVGFERRHWKDAGAIQSYSFSPIEK